MNYGFVVDNGSCIGCHACSTACKSENQVPLGVYRTWVKSVEVGQFPDVRRSFQVTRCNHCANPPCVRICPTSAMHQRTDGIVDFDGDACIGCKACMQACPYDAIYLDPESHTAAKCNYCAPRVDLGLEPACVVVCPEHAILAGDLDDPNAEISRVLAKHDVVVRKPEQGTAPKLFYIRGHDPSLHPTASAPGPSLLFADVPASHGHPAQPPSGQSTRADPRGTQIRTPDTQGLPGGGPIHVGRRMAEHMVQVGYNAQHQVQWHWPIPAYLVTKHIAGGGFLYLAAAAWIPTLPLPPVAMVLGGGLAIAMTLATLALLLYDLDRPDRFFYLLVRPQWRSWVARAAWILTGFSLVTTLWWTLEVAAWFDLLPALGRLRLALALVSAPLSLLTAVYTAFLFAQAEGRDLWQSSHLAPLMTAHAFVLGTAPFAAMPLVAVVPHAFSMVAHWIFAASLLASLSITLVGDLGIPHASDVARRAVRDMVRGAWRPFWLGGVVLGHLVPLLLLAVGGPLGAAVAFLSAAVGLFLYGYALVMAPQAVPNS